MDTGVWHLGWIVAGLIIGGLKIEPTTYIFMIAGV